MGFTNKTLVIIDVGIDDDTSMATLYLEIVRELKRDIFTQLHVFFFHYLVENNTINKYVGIYIYK